MKQFISGLRHGVHFKNNIYKPDGHIYARVSKPQCRSSLSKLVVEKSYRLSGGVRGLEGGPVGGWWGRLGARQTLLDGVQFISQPLQV